MNKLTDKKSKWLILPEPHSSFNDDEVEHALLDKARELLGEESAGLSYMLLSGNFFETKGYAYSAIRDWRGAAKPSATNKKKPLLDATFACLSVYLGSLVSFQVDFFSCMMRLKKSSWQPTGGSLDNYRGKITLCEFTSTRDVSRVT